MNGWKNIFVNLFKFISSFLMEKRFFYLFTENMSFCIWTQHNKIILEPTKKSAVTIYHILMVTLHILEMEKNRWIFLVLKLNFCSRKCCAIFNFSRNYLRIRKSFVLNEMSFLFVKKCEMCLVCLWFRHYL